MVAVVSTNPNERLIDNRVDGDVEINEEPTTLRQRLFAKRRTLIVVSAISFLVLVLASTLTGIFVARHRAVVNFRENLTQFLDEKFTLIEPEERALHVDELTELYRNGYITGDHVAEFEVMLEFGDFNKVYSRKHADAEERRLRFLAFRNSYHSVKTHSGEELYEKELNKFSDMTKEEFDRLFPLIPLENLKKETQNPSFPTGVTDPYHLQKLRIAKGLEVGAEISVDGENVDWRRCGGVSPVKDQSNCGSCWAFATIGAVESIYLIKKGQSLDLSEQELVNCEPHSHGCRGGLCDKALEYIEANGVSYSRDVPYDAVDERCAAPLSNKVFVDTHVPTNGLDILHNSLPVSPTTVYIAVSDELTQYKSGIYTGSCSENLNHAVLLVGEGQDEATGKRFWILKNSWGKDWGEDGFFRLERTGEGSDKCGILEFGYRPVLAR